METELRTAQEILEEIARIEEAKRKEEAILSNLTQSLGEISGDTREKLAIVMQGQISSKAYTIARLRGGYEILLAKEAIDALPLTSGLRLKFHLFFERLTQEAGIMISQSDSAAPVDDIARRIEIVEKLDKAFRDRRFFSKSTLDIRFTNLMKTRFGDNVTIGDLLKINFETLSGIDMFGNAFYRAFFVSMMNDFGINFETLEQDPRSHKERFAAVPKDIVDADIPKIENYWRIEKIIEIFGKTGKVGAVLEMDQVKLKKELKSGTYEALLECIYIAYGIDVQTLLFTAPQYSKKQSRRGEES